MSGRIARVNQSIKREIGLIIQFELQDPRLKFVTITKSDISKDLQHAKVFFTVLGDEEKIHDAQNALESAKGLVRKLIGQRLRMRYTPAIIFIFDTSIEDGFRLEKTLGEINEEIENRTQDN